MIMTKGTEITFRQLGAFLTQRDHREDSTHSARLVYQMQVANEGEFRKINPFVSGKSMKEVLLADIKTLLMIQINKKK